MAGWIKLHRKIQEHWLWEEPLYLKWWLDILLMANYAPAKILINGEVKSIDIGEHHTSISKLAERWNVNRKTVIKFLTLLESDSMITTTKSRQNGTTLKVANYKAFQAFPEGGEDIKLDNALDNELDIELDNGVDNELDIKKKYKELKEVKEVKQGEEKTKASVQPKVKPPRNIIPPSLEDVSAYCTERNNGIDPQEFIDFYQSKGWMIGKNKMKDWHAAVGTWEKRRKTQAPQGKPTEAKPKRSKFCNYQGREHDYDKEERMNQELLEREFQKRRERAVRDEL